MGCTFKQKRACSPELGMLELLVFGCLLERLAQYINDECTPLMLIRNEINGWILCARVCWTWYAHRHHKTYQNHTGESELNHARTFIVRTEFLMPFSSTQTNPLHLIHDCLLIVIDHRHSLFLFMSIKHRARQALN